MNTGEALKSTDQSTQFRRMYESSLPVVYGFILFRAGGDHPLAEDIAADTFAEAAAQYRAGTPDVVSISWLRTVAKRKLIDYWRRQNVAANKVPLLASVASNRESEPEIGDRDIVMNALGRLPSDQRAALVLQHIEGYNVREVADLLSKTAKATESLLSRARASFRAAYLEVDRA